jgi:hypothetical protein
MKTIIISDIGGKDKSIIPYGLHMGKHNETEVMIHHIIDPRMHQGTTTPYSDSQSVTPGNKLSHEEIFEREKGFARKQLDKLLSAEASRLNYPLKYDTSVEVESLDLKLRRILSEDKENLCVASMVPDNSMIADLDELLEITDKTELPLLLVPPGVTFKVPAAIVLVTDYSEASQEPVKRALNWFDSFPVTIKAFEIAADTVVKQKEQQREVWEHAMNNFVSPTTLLNTKILIGKKDKDNILEEIRKSDATVAMLSRNIFRIPGTKLKKITERKDFLAATGVPVVIY